MIDPRTFSEVFRIIFGLMDVKNPHFPPFHLKQGFMSLPLYDDLCLLASSGKFYHLNVQETRWDICCKVLHEPDTEIWQLALTSCDWRVLIDGDEERIKKDILFFKMKHQ